MACRLSAGGASRSTAPLHRGPTMIFSMYRSGACSRPPCSLRPVRRWRWVRPWRTDSCLRAGQRRYPPPGRRCSCRVRPADLFSDVEHGGVVAFAFADDDGAVHRTVSICAHGFDGGVVGLVAVTQAHGAGGSDRGVFNDAQKFQAELFFHVGHPPRRLILGQSMAYGRAVVLN